jgi:hypothetical protein
MHEYWQVASGAAGRDYKDDFLRLGIACVGGDQQVKIMTEVAEGDRILLKKGTGRVFAVGEVLESLNEPLDDEWLFDFDGWNLKAGVRVEWYNATKEILEDCGKLSWDAISRVHNVLLRERMDEVIRNGQPISTDPWDLSAMQNKCRPVPEEELLRGLIGIGLSPSRADDLMETFRRIRLLAGYYNDACDQLRCYRSDIREHEIRTFLVAPLLVALGWAEQQIKIELGVGGGKRVDMACFSRPYQGKISGAESTDCRLIVETKKFSEGLSPYAREQAAKYAERFPECRVIAVSNGYVYKTFVRDDDEFPPEPQAYLNLLRPRKHSLVHDKADGAFEVLASLLPGQE